MARRKQVGKAPVKKTSVEPRKNKIHKSPANDRGTSLSQSRAHAGRSRGNNYLITEYRSSRRGSRTRVNPGKDIASYAEVRDASRNSNPSRKKKTSNRVKK